MLRSTLRFNRMRRRSCTRTPAFVERPLRNLRVSTTTKRHELCLASTVRVETPCDTSITGLPFFFFTRMMEILVVLLSGSSVCTQALTFDGDVPWVVPQDLRVPSEPKTDNLASNALMMVSNSMSTFPQHQPPNQSHVRQGGSPCNMSQQARLHAIRTLAPLAC